MSRGGLHTELKSAPPPPPWAPAASPGLQSWTARLWLCHISELFVLLLPASQQHQ